MNLKPKRKAPIGVWQEEHHCGDCGMGMLVGKPVGKLPANAWPRTGTKCTAIYLGRRGNKCGWPTTVIWLFRRAGT